MKFKAMLHGHEIIGEVINPGEWFGKAWVVEVGCGFSSFFYAVEADGERGAIDALTDSEEHGHVIRMDSDDDRFNENDTPRAGNAGEPVDLDDVRIHGRAIADHRMHPTSIPFNDAPGCSDIVYITGDMLTGDMLALSPIDYANLED